VAAFLICLFIYAGSVFVAALSLVSAVRSGDAAEVMAVRICRASGIRSSTSHNFWSALRTGNDPGRPGAGAGRAGAARRATEAARRCHLASGNN
jgi:hypothetical protein